MKNIIEVDRSKWYFSKQPNIHLVEWPFTKFILTYILKVDVNIFKHYFFWEKIIYRLKKIINAERILSCNDVFYCYQSMWCQTGHVKCMFLSTLACLATEKIKQTTRSLSILSSISRFDSKIILKINFLNLSHYFFPTPA